jgi:hypothetical protein
MQSSQNSLALFQNELSSEVRVQTVFYDLQLLVATFPEVNH